MLKDTNCSFVAMTKTTMKKMSDIRDGYIIENNMLINCIKDGLKIEEVDVTVTCKKLSGIWRGLMMARCSRMSGGSVWSGWLLSGISWRSRPPCQDLNVLTYKCTCCIGDRRQQ